MGTSKWRRVQPFTTPARRRGANHRDLWTKAGNFSFLAADLENGPILAPEYGFFVRRTSELASAAESACADGFRWTTRWMPSPAAPTCWAGAATPRPGSAAIRPTSRFPC